MSILCIMMLPSNDSGNPTERQPTPEHLAQVASRTELDFGALVHEIAGLIDGSLRFVRLAQRGLKTPESRDAALSYLDSAGDALTQVAMLVRDASQSVSSLRPAAVGRALTGNRPLAEVIEHAAEVLQPLADERGVRLEIETESRLEHGPSLPLYPVVSNALRNAIEASRTGSTVSLVARWTEEQSGIEIVVLDEGPGLPAPGVQILSARTTTKPGHAGLGLAVCREIVSELNGTVTLHNRADRAGARFRVFVPVDA